MSELRVTNVTGPDGNPTAKFNGVERPEVPPGAVLFFAATTPPPGFLKANGATISRTVYASLFAAVGTTFGAGDGSTTFTLPDLRGEFPRGWDDGRGADSGRVFGSFQHAMHFVNYVYQVGGGTVVYFDQFDAGTLPGVVTGNYVNPTPVASSSARVPAAARPRNIALLACIKF